MAYASWKNITADLQAKIAKGDLKPGDRLPSGADIARQWGVNRHTAHRALEELQRAGFVVRQRGSGTVIAQPSGASAGRTPTGNVALLVDCYTPEVNFPSVNLLRGIGDGLGEAVNLVVAESKRDPETETRQLARLAAETDGVIVYPTGKEASIPALQALAASGFPLVVVDRVPPGVVADTVATDNAGATAHAVGALQEAGHVNVGFLSFHKPTFSSVMDRHAGFVRAMTDAGHPDPNALVRWLPLGSSQVREVFDQVVADALFSLRHGAHPVTALFCVEDSVAIAAMAACARMGLRVPEDLEIATFSDWQPQALGSPWNVHRISQRNYDLGLAAARLVLARMADPARPPESIRVPADFLPLDAGLRASSESVSS